MSAPPRLAAHLRRWVGAWPPPGPGISVVAADVRRRPGWDGRVRPLVGAVDADAAALVGVAPEHAPAVSRVLEGRAVAVLDDESVAQEVGTAVGFEDAALGRGVLRWDHAVPGSDELDDAGIWLDLDDPRVPQWLHPFGGPALVALVEGAYAAGVGVKRHDERGHELSVVTAPEHRGRGLARRLVAQAARAQRRHVDVVTYLHAPGNAASARVADACGFPDLGWSVLGVFGPDGEAATG